MAKTVLKPEPANWFNQMNRICRMALLTACGIMVACTTDTKNLEVEPEPPKEFYKIGALSEIARFNSSCTAKPEQDTRELYVPNTCMTPEYRDVLENPFPEEELRAQLVGKTSIYYSLSHGTQVSYNDPAGNNYLWYPGSNNIISGQWKFVNLARVVGRKPAEGEADQRPGNDVFCVKYQPVTTSASSGGNTDTWNCGLATEYIKHGRQESLDGDAFGLRNRGRVPFVMERGAKFSSAQLLSKIKATQ